MHALCIILAPHAITEYKYSELCSYMICIHTHTTIIPLYPSTPELACILSKLSSLLLHGVQVLTSLIAALASGPGAQLYIITI